MTSPATCDCCSEARWTLEARCACSTCHPSGPIAVPRPSLEEWVRSRQMHRDYGLKIFKQAERLRAERDRWRTVALRRRAETHVEGVGPGARHADPLSSHLGETDVKIRAGSHRTKILHAYATGLELTDERAARDIAGMPERSCWWKRCSELRQGGYIEPTGKLAISATTESAAMTCVITEKGKDALARIRTSMDPLT